MLEFNLFDVYFVGERTRPRSRRESGDEPGGGERSRQRQRLAGSISAGGNGKEAARSP